MILGEPAQEGDDLGCIRVLRQMAGNREHLRQCQNARVHCRPIVDYHPHIIQRLT